MGNIYATAVSYKLGISVWSQFINTHHQNTPQLLILPVSPKDRVSLDKSPNLSFSLFIYEGWNWELTSQFASTSEILLNSRPLFHSPHLSYNLRSRPCAGTLLLTVHLWPLGWWPWPSLKPHCSPGLPLWSEIWACRNSLDPQAHLAFPHPKPWHILFPLLGSLSHMLSLWPTPTYPIGPLGERSLPSESLLWLSPSSWGISAMWLPSTLAFPYHHSYQFLLLLLILLSGIPTQTWVPRGQRMCVFSFSWHPEVLHLTYQGDLTIIDWINEHLLKHSAL